jgi:hypothetical protein
MDGPFGLDTEAIKDKGVDAVAVNKNAVFDRSCAGCRPDPGRDAGERRHVHLHRSSQVKGI